MSYSDYEWYMKEDLSEYAGNWIVIIDKKIVAKGKDIEKLLKEVKTFYPSKTPFITKINNQINLHLFNLTYSNA